MPDNAEGASRSLLERALGVITEVKSGEGGTALLMVVNIFFIMAAYYVLKPAREAFMALEEGGAELASYTSGAMAVLLVPILKLYDYMAQRFVRRKLITYVTLIFIVNLVIFYYLATIRIPYLGVLFFIWLGIFNYMVVAQFWAFGNDLYLPAQGERLFPLIMIGQTVGAILGPQLADQTVQYTGETAWMLLVAGALLLVCIGFTNWIDLRVRRDAEKLPGREVREEEKKAEEALGAEGGFQLVFQHRYLLLIALLIMVLNLVNTTGEYILRDAVFAEARASDTARDVYAASYYADFFSGVNILTFLIQAFLVSRILKFMGVRGALFILPTIALFGYGSIAAVPVLMVITVMKTLENATDYSLMNTLRGALYLPTSREMKYKAKMAIDTFFVRAGDVVSAGVVFVGAEILSFGAQKFSIVVFFVVLAWLGLAKGIASEHKRISQGEGQAQMEGERVGAA